MAARFSYKGMDSQRLPVKLYEGTITKADKFGPDGLLVEDTVAYSAELQKGDKVIFYSDSNSGGEIVVTAAGLGSNDVDVAVGEIIDTPMGNDTATTSSGTPAHALRRSATIRCYGDPIVEEFDVDTGAAVRAQYKLQWSEDDAGAVEEDSSTLTAGCNVAMAYTAADGKVPVLMGLSGFMAAD
jgi:hypothetical protein